MCTRSLAKAFSPLGPFIEPLGLGLFIEPLSSSTRTKSSNNVVHEGVGVSTGGDGDGGGFGFRGGGQGGPPVSRITSDQYKVPEGGHVALHVTDLEYTQTSASDPHGFQQCRL